MSQQFVLRYWNLRGRTEPIRMLLNYLELDYTFKGYDDTQYVEWKTIDKPTLKTDFPNLPYLIDGDYVLSESDAIAQYICVKANREDLIGVKMEDRINIARIRGVINEQLYLIGMLAYDSEYKTKINESYEGTQTAFQQLDKYLINREYLNNGKICYYDFYLYELLFVANKLFSEQKIFESFPNLLSHFRRIQNLPQIKQYLDSDKYNPSFMIFGPYAIWNADSTLI